MSLKTGNWALKSVTGIHIVSIISYINSSLMIGHIGVANRFIQQPTLEINMHVINTAKKAACKMHGGRNS